MNLASFRGLSQMVCILALSATVVALGACGGDASNATPTVVAAATTDRTSTPPATIAASATPTVTMAPRTPTGDPVVIAQAAERFETFVATWVHDGPDVASRMLVASQRTAAGRPGEPLLSGTIKTYHLVRYESPRLLVLSITADLQFAGTGGSSWGGTNTRFVTFEGEPGAWLMYLATSPPVEGEPIPTYQ
jgi:hypothetical protein